MSVTYSKRRSLEKTGSDSESEQSLSDQYLIHVSSEDDDQVTILASNFADIPQIGDPHPNPASTATVKTRTVEPTENRLRWLLNVTYSDAINTGDQPGQGSATEVLTVSIGKWDESFTLEMDYRDDPVRVMNDAGDPIRLEATRPQFMMTISSITEAPRLSDFFRYQGKVNKDVVTWLGFNFGPDQLLFDEYKATTIGSNVWREDFIFKGKKVPDYISAAKDGKNTDAGWQPQLLNAGYREINDNGNPVPIKPRKTPGDKKSNEEPVTAPWPLDIDGKALARSELKEPDKIVFKEFVAYPRSDKPFDGGLFQFDFTKVLTRRQQRQIGPEGL